jgi:hypothetical protein
MGTLEALRKGHSLNCVSGSIISALLILFVAPAFAEDPPVFTDADLHKYKYKGDDKTRQYNERVIQQNQPRYEREESSNDYQQADSERNRKLERIKELEQERANEEIEASKRMKGTKWMEQRREEDRKEKSLKRETELDGLYRESGMSRERDMQRRTAEAEQERKKAEARAKDAETRGRTFYDPEGDRWLNCSGGICH